MDDPNYTDIEGEWCNHRPYIVLHRTCVSSFSKGKGVGRQFVTYATQKAQQSGISDLRADTHEKNASMRRMLEKEGFLECGTIFVADGSPRVACQLVLDER